jgi:hypothetical protein
VVSECKTLIKKDEKWKHINLNPSTSTMSGLLKIYKVDSPVRPVVNWKQAPAYKLAKLVSKKTPTVHTAPIRIQCEKLNPTFKDLREIPFNTNLHFVSFDIENMYTNFPTENLQISLASYAKSICWMIILDSK